MTAATPGEAGLHYAPFDQDDHLGEPPWSPDDPALQAWEAAHGHDVRLKCYPEFGCKAIEYQLDQAEAALKRVLALCDQAEHQQPGRLPSVLVSEIRKAVEGGTDG